MAKLNIVTKRTGDKLTATEFNAVVDAVNDNVADISNLQTGQSNMSNVVSSLQTEQNTQKQSISDMKADAVKMVVISQTDYDALVTAGTVDADTYYNILEE